MPSNNVAISKEKMKMKYTAYILATAQELEVDPPHRLLLKPLYILHQYLIRLHNNPMREVIITPILACFLPQVCYYTILFSGNNTSPSHF